MVKIVQGTSKVEIQQTENNQTALYITFENKQSIPILKLEINQKDFLSSLLGNTLSQSQLIITSQEYD